MNNKTKSNLEKFDEFFSTQYKKQVFSILEEYPNQRSVIVDYLDLEMFDPDLADLLIEKPNLVISAAKEAIKNIDSQYRNMDVNVRISNLTNEVDSLRSNYIGKLVAFPCVIEKISKIRPRIISATFECRGCMRRYEVIQTSTIISEPSICPECGGKSFRILTEESQFIDTQSGSAKSLYNPSHFNRISFVLEDDLVDSVLKNEKVFLTGILCAHRNKKIKEFDTYLYVNYCESLEETENKEIEDTFNPTNINPSVRDSAEYNEWRLEVLKRDNGECQCCGLDKRLHAHHIFGYEEYPLLQLDVSNGITLCQFCHDKYHSFFGLKDNSPANFVKFMRRFSKK